MSDVPSRSSAATSPDTRCRCGHSAFEGLVISRNRYSFFGWMLLAVGISALPQSVDRLCAKCGHIFETLTADEARERYRFR